MRGSFPIEDIKVILCDTFQPATLHQGGRLHCLDVLQGTMIGAEHELLAGQEIVKMFHGEHGCEQFTFCWSIIKLSGVKSFGGIGNDTFFAVLLLHETTSNSPIRLAPVSV